ncbi:MAG: hypothetical protein JKY37_16740 [Nannocystaceae bacterium]|nr:hypothetical protein [Nannocystaceae bacterium]
MTVLLTLCATTLGCSADSDDTETGGDEAAATDGTGSGPDSGGDDDGGDDSPGTGTNEGDGQDDAPDDGGEAPSDTAGTTGGETGTDSDSDTDPDTGTEAGSDDGSGMSAGSVDVMLSGCDVDFSGDIVVTYNGSLGVASVADQGGTLTGSFQFDLDGPATFALSTQHRVDTGTVINLVDPGQGTWTNLDPDSFGSKVDAVGGTLDVSVWTPSEGMAVIEFSGVSLVNVTTGNVCTIDGTVETEELYP